jgi:hypothetical protein
MFDRFPEVSTTNSTTLVALHPSNRAMTVRVMSPYSQVLVRLNSQVMLFHDPEVLYIQVVFPVLLSAETVRRTLLVK